MCDFTPLSEQSTTKIEENIAWYKRDNSNGFWDELIEELEAELKRRAEAGTYLVG